MEVFECLGGKENIVDVELMKKQSSGVFYVFSCCKNAQAAVI